jgi:hypothetical protein
MLRRWMSQATTNDHGKRADALIELDADSQK